MSIHLIKYCRYVHKENADIILEVQLPSGFEFLEFANKNIYHQPFNHYEVSDNNSKIKWFFYKVRL